VNGGATGVKRLAKQLLKEKYKRIYESLIGVTEEPVCTQARDSVKRSLILGSDPLFAHYLPRRR